MTENTALDDHRITFEVITALSGTDDPAFLTRIAMRPAHEVDVWVRSRGSAGEVHPRIIDLERVEESTVLSWQDRILEVLSDQPVLVRHVAVAFFDRVVDHARAADLVLVRLGTSRVDEVEELSRIARRAGADREVIDRSVTDRALALGDLDQVVRRCEPYLRDPGSPWAIRAAAVARFLVGGVDTSLSLFARLPIDDVEGRTVGAVIALLTGRPDVAEDLSPTDQAAPTTGLSSGLQLMLRGLRHSLHEDPRRALPSLVQASNALRPFGSSLVLPEAPAALAAHVAWSTGSIATITDLLEADIEAEAGGPVATRRNRLLTAWPAMVAGRLPEAEAESASLPVDELRLPPRDMLVLFALRLGIARRRSDVPALHAIWQSTKPHLLQATITLDLLAPLGELVLAAARLDDLRSVAVLVDEAEDLLARLGNPAMWTPLFAWSRLQAAILAEDPVALRPQAEVLAALAPGDPMAAVLAAAGRTWIQVLAGEVETSEVRRSADQLHAYGLTWDASKLAALAAARATDREAMRDLMETARRLQALSGTGTSGSFTSQRSGQLTAREWQVAQLALAGLPYRDIGERLFISPKTVEHHMARIRRKVGATSRQELLQTLRSMLQGDTAR